MSDVVLVADADPFNLQLLSELCAALGYEAMNAGDGEAVLDLLARQRPRLLVMDMCLPVLDGLSVLRILKADAGLSNIPVLLVTPEGDVEARQTALELGADDYVTKPYRTFEIQQRIRTVLQLRAAQDAVHVARSSVAVLDTVDPLTGAGTSSQLHIGLDYEFTRAVRYRHPLSCVVVRCANFDALVGELGPAASQSVMLPLSGALKVCIRNVDHLFRSAEAELTILLPETGAKGCRIVVNRLEAAIARKGLFARGGRSAPDVRVGWAAYPELQPDDGEALWRSAREASAGRPQALAR